MSFVNHYAIEVCSALTVHCAFIFFPSDRLSVSLSKWMPARNKEINNIKTAYNKQHRDNERASKERQHTFSSAILFDIFMRCWHKQEYVRQHIVCTKRDFFITLTHSLALLVCSISQSVHWANTFSDKQKDKHISEKKTNVIYSHVSHNLQAVAIGIDERQGAKIRSWILWAESASMQADDMQLANQQQ